MYKFFNATFNTDSDELLEVFDELPYWAAPFGIKLFDNIVVKKNIKALDIGFGAGFPLTELAMRLGKTSTVYGIDPWEAAIKRTEKKIRTYLIDNIEIIRGVAENIPLDDNFIDLIVSNNGINNVSDINKTLSECNRVMKSGGQFILTMNLEDTMHEFYDVLENVLDRKGLYDEIKSMHTHIYDKRKPLDEFCSLLEKHSFKIRKTVIDQFEYTFADGDSMINYFPIGFYFLPSWKSLVPNDRVEEIFNEVLFDINNIAEKEGYFKLTVPFAVIDCYKS